MNICLVTGLVLAVGASEQPVPDLARPVSPERAVAFSDVRISDAFWAPRRKVNREVSLRYSLEMLEKAGNLPNVDLAAQGKHEGYQGPVFMDSDLFKAMEAIAYSLATDPDPELDARLDAIIARLAAAQMADGYLNTWYQVNAPEKRFSNLRDHHELYCAGHLFEAAVAHARGTGKKTLLAVATKYADLLCATFGEGPGKRAGYCGHPEVELALMRLAALTGEAKYADLAAYFVRARGSHFFAIEHGTPAAEYDGSYWQDERPVCDLEHVTGHAVRFGYLLSAAVDVGSARAGTAEGKSLLAMAKRVWRSTALKNMYVTGGIGPSAANEGFTRDYDLPNLSAYQETCASVANAMWNHRMAIAFGDGRYADVMEQALYNGVLAGVSFDGKRFFYVNPLASNGGHHRSAWFSCACCPPNATRTLAQLGGYAYGANDTGLWVNLYIQGGVKVDLPGSKGALALQVTSDYPWDGRVSFKVEQAPARMATVRLRLPGWCAGAGGEGASVALNGAPLAQPSVEKGYLVVERTWYPGDTLNLDLPMPVRRVEAHPAVADDRGRLAIARGPLVYCVEGQDVSAPLGSLAVPAEAELTATRRTDLFGEIGGVVTISGQGFVAGGEFWEGGLYRTAPAARKVAFTAIPYYAWDQRAGAGPMQVWLPTSPPAPKWGGPEVRAKVSMSFVSGNAEPEGVRDGVEPKNSAEQPAQCCHWWPHKGTSEWVGYSWEKARRISGASVYWFDDTGRGECRLPRAARVVFKAGEEWKPVLDAEGKAVEVPIARDRWCEVKFAAIEASALRLEVDLQPGWAAGVHEWRVMGEDE